METPHTSRPRENFDAIVQFADKVKECRGFSPEGKNVRCSFAGIRVGFKEVQKSHDFQAGF